MLTIAERYLPDVKCNNGSKEMTGEYFDTLHIKVIVWFILCRSQAGQSTSFGLEKCCALLRAALHRLDAKKPSMKRCAVAKPRNDGPRLGSQVVKLGFCCGRSLAAKTIITTS